MKWSFPNARPIFAYIIMLDDRGTANRPVKILINMEHVGTVHLMGYETLWVLTGTSSSGPTSAK